MANLESLVQRLEAVTTRLEATEGRLSQATPLSSLPPLAVPSSAAAMARDAPVNLPNAAPAAAPSNALPLGNALTDYDDVLTGPVAAVVEKAKAVGGEVDKVTLLLEEAFKAERNVIAAMLECKKPDTNDLQQLVAPVGQAMMDAAATTAGPKGPFFDHCKCVGEALQGLSWVVLVPEAGGNRPDVHVDECWQSGEFYANKVLKKYKGEDQAHVDWVMSVKELFVKLKAFVKANFSGGPTWNPSGIPVGQFLKAGGAGPPTPKRRTSSSNGGAAPPPPPPPGPPPPPPPPGPPPPPDAGKPVSKSSSVASGMSAVFADINKGDAITSGLRKVTADMKTKNRTDRSGVVAPPTSGGAAATKPPLAGGSARPAGPPILVLEQTKWRVENQQGNRDMTIEATKVQTAYVYNCHNSVLQVQGKINAITLDSCSKVGVLFESVVASCDIVNSKTVDVQVTGTVPTIAIDKSDGCQIYLNPGALGVEITTSKCSAINVVVSGGEDLNETNIPEQYVSRFKDGVLVTEPMKHSSA